MAEQLTRLGTAACILILTFLKISFFSSAITEREIKQNSNARSPVILVPGYASSQLEAKLNKPRTKHFYCWKRTKHYFTLWLNIWLLLPGIINCWADNMRLIYNTNTRTTSNTPGVDIRVPGFGSTKYIEWLQLQYPRAVPYFNSLVESLVLMGYVRDDDIKGAPYDFRKAPNEMNGYYNALKTMTERMYEKKKMPVTFICHSMGCPVMLYFFNKQSQEWKNMYVQKMISLAGAWAGTVRAVETYRSGANRRIKALSPLKMRVVQRSSPSIIYMTPSDSHWKKNEVLVETPNKNYTLGNWYDFYRDLGHLDGWEMYRDTYNLTRSFTAPGVELHCVYSRNTRTAQRLVYTSNSPDGKYQIIYGDGLINLRSLEGCSRFKNKQRQKVQQVLFGDIKHYQLLYDKEVLAYIQNVI